MSAALLPPCSRRVRNVPPLCRMVSGLLRYSPPSACLATGGTTPRLDYSGHFSESADLHFSLPQTVDTTGLAVTLPHKRPCRIVRRSRQIMPPLGSVAVLRVTERSVAVPALVPKFGTRYVMSAVTIPAWQRRQSWLRSFII